MDGKYNPMHDIREFVRKDIYFYFDLTCLSITSRKAGQKIKHLDTIIIYYCIPLDDINSEEHYPEIPQSIINIICPIRKPIPANIRSEVFDKFNHECVFCGSSYKLEIDHIIPVTKGGSSEISNLQVLCKSCNLKKFNHLNYQHEAAE